MKIAFLLDSSACIPVLRNKTGSETLPDPARTGIPVIVAAELWNGVKQSIQTRPLQNQRLTTFLSFIPIVDFDIDAAIHSAEIRSALEAAGTLIGPLDLLVAAQARSLDATIVTANVREFKRATGIKVLNCT